MSTEQKKHKGCSFCEQSKGPERRMLQGPHGAICEDCVNFGYNFFQLEEKKASFNYASFANPPSPEIIKQQLDKYIIGQDHAKKVLSVAAYNHYMRVYHNNKTKENSTGNPKGKVKEKDVVSLEKSNILLVGPTGTGKTLLAKTLARILKVPFAIADATSLTEAGYVGEDVENVLLKLYQASDGGLGRASHGIIFIDEIDKITRKTKNMSITRDVSGEGVQHALLKIIEGTIASIPPQGGRKHPHQQMIKMNTENILFICSGAFVGLDKIIGSRIFDNKIGFDNLEKTEIEKPKDPLSMIHPDDLINYGLVPELVGRIPIIATLEDHNIQSLYKILTEPKNSIIKQMQTIFSYSNIELVVEEEARIAIAKKALEQKIGARGIRSILEKILLDTMFSFPSRSDICKVIVNKNSIEQDAAPLVEYLSQSKVESS